MFLLLSSVCWAGGKKDKNTQTESALPTSPFYSGDGGKGISLAILAPQANGIAENQSYLPTLIQGEFVSNFSGFSAISVLDRQRLDDQYTELFSGYYSDDAEGVYDLGYLTPTTHILGGNITRTTTGYALQMHITKTADKMTVASYSGTFSFVELDNLIGIRRASLDLLEKMGILPTERTRTELAGGAAASHVNAQTALAQGITAQQKGIVVEALAHFHNAVSFEPNLSEANSRLSTLASNVSSGNIGENVRNDIQLRNEWIKLLNEALEYFSKYPPFEIVVQNSLTQGHIDYAKETVVLETMVTLQLSSSFKVINDLRTGLRKTGKAEVWGFGDVSRDFTGWPFDDRLRPGIVSMNYSGGGNLSGGYRGYERVMNLDIVLLNENGSIVSRGRTWTGTIRGYVDGIARIDYVFEPQGGERRKAPQIKMECVVNANDITDNMAIKIISIDGVDLEKNPDYIRIIIK